MTRARSTRSWRTCRRTATGSRGWCWRSSRATRSRNDRGEGDPMPGAVRISRRTVLRGLGTAVALPWLEAMAPAAELARGEVRALPKRMAFLYVPNGAHMQAWTPEKEGADF